MDGPAVILREIHRLRRHAQNLRAEIERGPRMLKAQQHKIAKQEEAVRQAQDGIKKTKVQIHEKETEIKGVQQQIAKYEQQRNQATSKKEYDAFNHEIATARQKVQQLEDRVLELMLDGEQKTAELPELEKAVQQAKQERTQFEQGHQGRVAGLTEQLKQAERELKEAEGGLPADLAKDYQRQVGSRGEDALAAVKDRTCGACYTAITAQDYNDLLQANFVKCKSCGRILYLPQ